MYTVCYVVADNKKLGFYNELLISLASLRGQHFNGPVVVLTDNNTAAELEKQNRSELREMSAELRIVDIPEGYSQKEKSRFIKTSMREYIDGDFLYIDTDTIIADTLPDIVSEHEIALVKDAHGSMIECGTVDYFENLYKKCSYTFDASSTMFNSGVIWCKDTDTTRSFFHSWHMGWKYTLSCEVVFDQPSLNKLNVDLGGVIEELDGRFNVQVSRSFPIEYLVNAYIIHYYNDFDHSESCFLLQQPELQNADYRSETISRIIESPKGAFIPCRLVKKNGIEDQISKTESYGLLLSLFTKRKTLFNFVDATAAMLRKVRRTLHR